MRPNAVGLDRSLGQPIDVVVAAADPDGEARGLREAAIAPYVPDLVLASVAPGDTHVEWPLFVGRVARSERATAYACRGLACDEPTVDPARLSEQIRARDGRRR